MGRRVNFFFLGGVILLAALLRLRGIANPLLDDQAWRQADTAGMGFHMLGHLGDFPDVWAPLLNYDGVTPQKAELEFPFLPYLMALAGTAFSWSDIWGRLWAVVFSSFALVGIYDLGRKVLTARVGLLAAGIYAVTPLAVYYGRVVMPDPVAQALGIWALDLVWRWRHALWGGNIWAAGVLMSLAILAKLPQLMLLPVALMSGFWPFKRTKLGVFVLYSTLAIFLPVVYYTWVHMGAPEGTRFVSGIISGQVIKGPAFYWDELYFNIRDGLTLGAFVLTFAGGIRLILAAYTKKNWQNNWLLIWFGITILYTLTVCARIPLDYYLMPALPLVCLLCAYALDYIEGEPGLVLGVVFCSLLWWNSSAWLAPKYVWDERYLSQAEWLRVNTPMGSTLILSDEPPMTFYYAQRVGFRLNAKTDEEALSQLRGLPGEYLVRLPGTVRGERFWQIVSGTYRETGPGVYLLRPAER